MTVMARRQASQPRRGVTTSIADQGIYERIRQAIIEHQLPPGTKLREESLCGVFGISRPRVRKILQRMAHDQLVELYPNRGAYVAQPSVKEAQDIFAARRILEPGVVASVIRSITRAQIKELKAFVAAEKKAEEMKDRQTAIRLSGEFHLRVAEMAGNDILTRFLQELVSRTSLIIALYETPGAPTCNCSHHEELVKLIAAGDATRAAAFMEHHLGEIEANLDLEDGSDEPIDLERVFSGSGNSMATPRRPSKERWPA